MQEQVNPIAQQLAEQLRDVHLPENVSWWPLAFGWWLLITFIILSVISATVLLLTRRRANRYRKTALVTLTTAFETWQERGNVTDYLKSANGILKRTMLSLGQRAAVSQSGADWISSLNALAKTNFSGASQNALAYECYKARPEVDVETLNEELIVWIKTHSLKIQSDNNAVSTELTPKLVSDPQAEHSSA